MKSEGYILVNVSDADGKVTVRYCDGHNWYDSLAEYCEAGRQRQYELELSGREPDAWMTMCTGGKEERIPIWHER